MRARTEGPRGLRLWGRALILLLVLSLLALGAALFSLGLRSTGPRDIAVALHSALKADYSADPRGALVAAVEVDIIEAAIQDAPTTAIETPGRFATLAAGLQTPVPTVTPRPTQPGGESAPSPTGSALPADTITPGAAEASPTPSASATPTAVTFTPSPTVTRTPRPPATSTRLPTQPPTNTTVPTSSFTPVVLPTDTPPPPPPTDTPLPPPTETPPPPPTNTPPCSYPPCYP